MRKSWQTTYAMQATIISDTSCLIVLYKVQQLELLRLLFTEIITTQTVAAEFGEPLPKWISIQEPKDKRNKRFLNCR